VETLDWQQEARKHFIRGRYEEAARLYEKCLDSSPEEISHYGNLGLALLLAGDPTSARTVWLSGTLLFPETGLSEMVSLLEEAGCHYSTVRDYQAAEQIYREILELSPTSSKAANNLGNVIGEQGRVKESIDCYQLAIALKPEDPKPYYNLGLALYQEGRVTEAISCYQKCLELDSTLDLRAMSYYNLGNSFCQQHREDEAIACFQRALELSPNLAIANNNLGNAYKEQGKLETAIACFQKAIKSDRHLAEAHYNLGHTFQIQNRLDEALACFNRTLAIDATIPAAHWNRGLILLQSGDYLQGFADLEYRWHIEKIAPIARPQPLWDGSDLEGRTVLLHSEYGFGDAIHFVRYVPLVAKRNGKVIIECQPELVRLFNSVAGVSLVVARGESLPPLSLHLPFFSLPKVFATTVNTIPARIPYLSPPTTASIQLPHSSTKNLKVGIVWAGSADNPNDRYRSCSGKFFAKLAQIPNVEFYSLQKGDAEKELEELPPEFVVHNLSSQLEDFADTAAAIAQLDLIIAVDTAVAHLAGALGKQVWLLLSVICDWRWLKDTFSSPWYPTMRLFRQNTLGDWMAVFSQVETSLQELALKRSLTIESDK